MEKEKSNWTDALGSMSESERRKITKEAIDKVDADFGNQEQRLKMREAELKEIGMIEERLKKLHK